MDDTRSDNVLEVSHLEKRIGEKVVLRDISFTVGQGVGLAVIGPNGAGKTTLLKVLSGIWSPSGGTVWRLGRRLGAEARSDPSVGFLGHQSFLYPHLTARENLTFYARLWGMDDAGGEALRALERVGLGFALADPVRTYSRGMVQRAAIARALLTRPRLLLMDEPYTGLDGPGQALLDRELQAFKAGGGSLMLITHNLSEALKVADAVVFLIRGRLVWWGDASDWEVATLSERYREWLVRGGHHYP